MVVRTMGVVDEECHVVVEAFLTYCTRMRTPREGCQHPQHEEVDAHTVAEAEPETCRPSPKCTNDFMAGPTGVMVACGERGKSQFGSL